MKALDLKQDNGKPLPKSWRNTLTKLIAAGILREDYRDVSESEYKLWERRNPFTGVTVQLPRIAADLYDWIVSVNPIKGTLTRADWDNARYIFNSCWSKEYYDLID